MAMAEKIKILLIKRNKKATDLAKALNCSPTNIYNKLKRDNFSEKELQTIAEALDVKYEGYFFLDNGEQI